jgi:hypothetical protein
MYATARRYEGVLDTAAAAKKVDEVFVPLISELPGFVEYYWIDLGGGAMMSITTFKTLSDAIEANRLSRDWVRDHLGEVLAEPIRTEAGRIVTHLGS